MKRLTNKILGFKVPPPAPSAGHYAPFVVSGGIISIVQGPLLGKDMPYRGRVGNEVSHEEAMEAARLCAANILVQLESACKGDLDRVACCYRLGGFLNTVEGFTDHSLIMNAASDVIHRVIGQDMQHSRYVVGCNSLPYNLTMELEGWFAIKGDG